LKAGSRRLPNERSSRPQFRPDDPTNRTAITVSVRAPTNRTTPNRVVCEQLLPRMLIDRPLDRPTSGK